MPESHFDGSMTITAVGFEKAPMGGSSVVLSNFKLSLGLAGGEELGADFGANLLAEELLQPSCSGSTVTAADNGQGQIVFTLDTPYEYTGGNLLIDMSFSNVSGSVYVWSWDAGGNRIVSGNGATSDSGTPYSYTPVIIIKGE